MLTNASSFFLSGNLTDINGSITSLVPLASAQDKENNASLLFSTSHDRMLRLHTWPIPTASSPKQESNGNGAKASPFVSHSERGRTILSVFTGGAAAVGVAWDGHIPQAPQDGSRADSQEAMEDADESMRRHGDSDDNEDEVWDAMQEVGDEPKRKSQAKSRGASATNGAADSASGQGKVSASPGSGADAEKRGQRGADGAGAENGAADDDEERDEEAVKEERSKRNRK